MLTAALLLPPVQFTTPASITNLLGADKGNVGQCGGALTSALREHPDAVVVLDEFEKAHESFADVFLNAFGANGFFSDSCADNGAALIGCTAHPPRSPH
jgi:ATP-dependent Clp protease ATP-binding subunit ClpA